MSKRCLQSLYLPPAYFMLRLSLCVCLWLASWLSLGQEHLSDSLLLQEQNALATADLPEEQRKQAADWLGQAQQWLRQAQTAQSDRQALEQAVREAPARLLATKKLLAQPEKSLRLPSLDLSRPLEGLEIQLTEEEKALSEDKAALEKQGLVLTELLSAATTGGNQIAELETQLAEVEAELKTISPSPTTPLERAYRFLLEAKRLWLQAELERLRLRQSNLPLLTELNRAERDLLALKVAERQALVERLRQAVQAARTRQVLGAANRARQALTAHELEIRPDWAKNVKLWEELEALLGQEQTLKAQVEQRKRVLETWQDDFAKTQQAIALAGADETLAQLLHKRLRSLPAATAFQAEAKVRTDRLRQAIASRLEIEGRLLKLSDLDSLVEARLQKLPSEVSAVRRTVLAIQWREALQNRREALTALQQEYTRYLSALSELDAREKQLLRLSKAYRAYIERNLLWIRYQGIPQAGKQIPAWLQAAPNAFQALAQQLWQSLQRNWQLPALVVLGEIALLLLRARIKQDLANLAQTTRSIRTDRFRNSLRALLDTLLLAAPVPLLLFGLGVWLKRTAPLDHLAADLAEALIAAAEPWATLGLLRQVCRPDGLAHRHLRWLAATRTELARQLHWFQYWTSGCTFVIACSGGLNPTPTSLGLGRWTFVVLMLSASALVFYLWRKSGPILSELAATRPSWVVTYQPLWLPLAVALPVVIAAGAAIGYYYAALYLSEAIFRVLVYFVALMLVKDFLLRWLYVTERRLRYQEILRRREEIKAQREEVSESEVPAVEEPQVDFGRLSEQTRRLLRVGLATAGIGGLWLIWKDAVPALVFLEQVTLPMTTTKLIGGVRKEVPLTLADAATGLLLGLITVLAAKNLPGLLEFVLFQRLPLNKGARYAWTALSQYLIAAVGIYVIFSSLGVQWEDIQWLIAALSVGVGFGLQEVVANFISGLILLFERPIRVGDLVTIGNVTGTVSRIRIRATTILNWDRQELIIPNKNFITGEFINWTLTDTINRIRIEVGIAYSSDVEQAMRLIEEAAAEHPEVLTDPKPLVSFEGFGDNALLLVLRAYLGKLDDRLATITELHQAIYAKFRAAGIEIAFPQRDVHLDTSRPLEVMVRQAEPLKRPAPEVNQTSS